MKHLATLILLALSLTLPSCKYFKGKKLFGRKADTMAVWIARQDSIRVADSLNAIQARLQAIENARLDSIRLLEEEKLSRAMKYNIIVGSFKTPEYARDWASEYERRGFSVQIIPLEGTDFMMVSAEAHDGIRNAVKRLEEFQDTLQIDAWIYRKK